MTRATPAVSGCDTWLGGSGLFSTATNWSTGVVPTDGTNTCITASGTYTVTVSGNQSVGDLTLGGISGKQTLFLLATPATKSASALGSSLNIYGDTATIGTNGVLETDETGNTSASAIELYGGPTTTVTNHGAVKVIGAAGATTQIDSNLTNTASGTVTISGPDVYQANATTLINQGSITIASTATLGVIDGASFTDNAGTLVVDGAYAQDGGIFRQSGGTASGNPLKLTSVTLDDSKGAANFDIYDNSSFNGSILANQSVTVEGTPTNGITLGLPSSGITNDGTLKLNETGKTSASDIELYGGPVANNGKFQVTGIAGGTTVTVQIDSKLTNTKSGTVTISDPNVEQSNSTTITNDGDFVVSTGANITIESGSVYSQGSTGTFTATVNASTGAFGLSGGAVKLNGKLAIDTVGTPKNGRVYLLVKSPSSLAGRFATIGTGSDKYKVAYLTNGVSATFEGRS